MGEAPHGRSWTRSPKAASDTVKSRQICHFPVQIDLPGLFDPEKDEKELKPALIKCITECSPGPHALLIVLNIEEYTEKGKDVISRMNEYLSEDVFKHAIVVFTHGDSLPRRQRVKDFVKTNSFLKDLVEKCGNRCHVIDNKHWSKRSKYRYRNIKYQVKKLLKSIEKTVEANNGSCYTNKILQDIEKIIKQEEKHIAESSRNIPEEKVRETAQERVYNILKKAAGFATGAVTGAFFGVLAVFKGVSVAAQLEAALERVLKAWTGTAAKLALDTAGKPTAAEQVSTEQEGKGSEGTRGLQATGIGEGMGVGMPVLAAAAGVGAIFGGIKGYEAAEKAETPWEAATEAFKSVSSSGFTFLDTSQDFISNLANRVSKPLSECKYNN
uniref:AIG1-type G domain-containing protein n=1 Tax=Cyprinodon variegatus TaxID=28743 RepID=A0A3Q2G4L8_CYPVA